jgi:hypothetical protein
VAGKRRLQYGRPMRLRTRLLTTVCLVATLAAASLAAAGIAAAASFGRAVLDVPEYVLVTRDAGRGDSLWLVNPEEGSAVAAGSLPGHAGAVALAPGGLTVAYLPASGAPSVWIADGSKRARVVRLSAGVRRVRGLTWIDDRRLVVSAAAARTSDLSLYRLYTVDAFSGRVRPFRGLTGVEPSAAPGAHKLAYVRVTRLLGGRLVRETLKLLSLRGRGSGQTLETAQYSPRVGRRSFARPLLSTGARWLLTGKTSVAARVTYAVRDASGRPLLTLYSPARQAGAWDAAGVRAALAGELAGAPTTDACVWVYDVADGSLLRTPAGLLGDVALTSVAWSPTGTRLAAEAVGYDAEGSSRHLFVLPADLAWFRDLGEGGLPVWIRR